MADDNRLAKRIKAQITRFAGRMTEGWPKPLRRLVGQVLYGRHAGRSKKRPRNR